MQVDALTANVCRTLPADPVQRFEPCVLSSQRHQLVTSAPLTYQSIQ